MRKCKHRCPYDASSVDILNEAEPRVSLLGQRRCMDCGEAVPYGPSNDEPEAVKVEMRAAEIAATLDPGYWRPGMSDADVRAGAGWNAADLGFADTWCSGDPECLAGYLARAITTHQDPTE